MRAFALALLILAAVPALAFWSGQIAQIPFGYPSISTASLGGSAYVCYTAQGLSGVAAVCTALSGPSEYVVPVPPAGNASTLPVIFTTGNGTLALLWTTPGLEGLYLSLLPSSKPLELLRGAYVASYVGAGDRVYVLRSLCPICPPTELLVFNTTGALLDRAPARGLAALLAVQSGLLLGRLANGSYVLMNSSSLAPIAVFNSSWAGLSGGSLFTFSEGVLRWGNLSFMLPWASGATPAVAGNKTFVVAWGNGSLSVYLAEGGRVELRRYPLPGVLYAEALGAGDYLYIVAVAQSGPAYSLWAFVVPATPPRPSLSVSIVNATLRVSWAVPNPEQYNVTSVALTVYHNGSLIFSSHALSGNASVPINATGLYTARLYVASPLGDVVETGEASYTPPAQTTTTTVPPPPPPPPPITSTSAPSNATSTHAVEAQTGSPWLYRAAGFAVASAALAVLVVALRRKR
ncbi:hypothetical protein [Thermoproteus tenax]|uniref:Uncharacterized protein n=1 Tax=Thermoproteus tenax (strain ATCC 35583 / DSM 2078 / JCM 9277 / NBRC 100435 / Kra 1) TaxID=768679 RepID=G4RN27_THETK|nr:hypothetical protein [Thermoproteus tenax]CCC80971.1 hypothetical protein TTX_0295 [Thermoproteus tenax Kra 1]